MSQPETKDKSAVVIRIDALRIAGTLVCSAVRLDISSASWSQGQARTANGDSLLVLSILLGI